MLATIYEEIVAICMIGTIVAGLVVSVIVVCAPLPSEQELEKRSAKKREKRRRSVDVLNVESKGGN